jgi:hypothetical protein
MKPASTMACPSWRVETRWLAANNTGGTMIYASMGHIHMDTGPYHFVSLGAGARGASRHHAHINTLTRARALRVDGWL